MCAMREVNSRPTNMEYKTRGSNGMSKLHCAHYIRWSGKDSNPAELHQESFERMTQEVQQSV